MDTQNGKETCCRSHLRVLVVFSLYSVIVCGPEHVLRALEYVHNVQYSNCTGGTEEVLPLEFDHSIWNQYTDPAIRTANFLSKVLAKNNGSLDSLGDELIFSLVRNNVHGDSIIFGSAIAIETGIYLKYPRFCPYAYKKNNTVRSHDISINYDYADPSTEWYNSVRIKSWENVTIATDGVSYRQNNVLLPEEFEMQPVSVIGDGHWTKPYFDCGGGDIWMITYSSPIFQLNSTTLEVYFRGVATIDIELTFLDINQCDVGTEYNGGLDFFLGTHSCPETTSCVPVVGRGFVTGSYKCVCADGYYFPDKGARDKFFMGDDVEFSATSGSVQLKCTPCMEGCDTCVDDSPCLYQSSTGLLYLLLTLMALTMIVIISTSIATNRYKENMAVKTSSPVFLQLMCLGGFFMCSEFFLLYVKTSDVVCIIRIWPFHLGFTIMYMSLIVKTWRISVIFRVGAQKRIRLPDNALLQRVAIMIVTAICVLTAWTLSGPPEVETLKTTSGLKYFVCSIGWWEYGARGAEILLLLYGVYLCYTVRKAPAHFNESKHITWAIYNAIILGSVLALMSRLFVTTMGPDMLYVLEFLQIQVYVTITCALLFLPKFWALYKKIEPLTAPGTIDNTRTIMTITGRLKAPATAKIAPLSSPFKQSRTIGTQTDQSALT